MFQTNFLDPLAAKALVAQHGSPLFVYGTEQLIEQAEQLVGLELPYGFTARFAMKANPHPEILKIFREQGIGIDASSGYEAAVAIAEGFNPQDILLTSQQLPGNLKELVAAGVQFTATSLHQLEAYGRLFPATQVSIRINPGIGSGHSVKTNVGGVTSSFGIWHEYLPQVLELAKQYELTIHRLHTHIGSGTDAEIWQDAARTSLALSKQLPDVSTLNLGGGFKVGRLDGETSTDLTEVARAIARELTGFQQDTGRELRLELEPGSFLVANAGILIARVTDMVDTGREGFSFLKLDTGMNDILRPSLYGAQHPLAVLGNSKELAEYVVVGHNCESGDLLTPLSGEPETLGPRSLTKAAIGDLVLIGGCGAYCASMSAHGYNSFPSAGAVII